MPKIRIDNSLLYYEIYGKGNPLLLVSGLGSDSSSWSGVTGEFSLHFQTIVFDNRGSGRSDIAYDKQCTIHNMAEDTIKLLDSLKIEQTHIIGHSMGGYIAQELAINYPERVDKLILVNTAPVSSERNNILFADIYNQLKREGYCRAWFERWIPLLFSPKLSNNIFIETFIKNSIQYPYLQKADGFKNQIEAIALFDVRNRIADIKAKTLILEGDDDILITPKEAEMLAKNIPKSSFRLLNGVAHSIHIENPRLFTDTVLEFLNNY